MSKSTLRKRIALTATTALFAGMLSFVATPAATAAAGDTNLAIGAQATNADVLLVATQNSTTGASIISSATDSASSYVTPRSLGLLTKDSTTGTAQTATLLAGGSLSIYGQTTTDVAFVASAGSFSGATVSDKNIVGSYSQDVKSVFLDAVVAANTTTAVAVRWTAPTTAGTYTVSMNKSSSTTQLAAGTYSGTLVGQVTVTVVAASGGGSYSAPYSACNTRSAAQGHGLATGVDTTTAFTNAQTAYIAFDADDAYDASLDSGAIVVTATGGALISLAANASTAAAGTTSTVVSSAAPTDRVVQVTQGTANAPVTTTVTVTYNGTTICTKTVTIRGEVAKLTVANVGVQDLSGSTVTVSDNSWTANTLGDASRAGMFTVVATDSAGNTVIPDQSGFAADSATLTTTVQAISISSANVATSLSSSASPYGSTSVGTWTCGSAAGSSNVKLKYTNATSGTTVSSDAFAAGCADDPYTYTASFDKASYVQGELATLTVQFLDSKGNKANTVGTHGAMTDSTPMLTRISSATGTIANKATGSRTYTYSVGTSTGLTAGSYIGTVSYASLVAGTTQTPAYKVSTGSGDVTNAEVLKSIVALIASINKQIQALQKLILKK
jgi:hypothetical protein